MRALSTRRENFSVGKDGAVAVASCGCGGAISTVWPPSCIVRHPTWSRKTGLSHPGLGCADERDRTGSRASPISYPTLLIIRPLCRGQQHFRFLEPILRIQRQTYSCRSTTRPRTFPPLFKSLSAALACSAGRVSIGIGGTLPAGTRARSSFRSSRVPT